MSNSTAVKVSATLQWAFLDRKNVNKWNQAEPENQKFQVDVTHMSPAAVAKLESLGIEVKDKAEKGRFLTCKSKFPIAAYDTDGITLVGTDENDQPLAGNIKIANGSVATITLSTFEGRNGTGVNIKRLVVTDLIEYEAEDAGFDDLDVL